MVLLLISTICRELQFNCTSFRTYQMFLLAVQLSVKYIFLSNTSRFVSLKFYFKRIGKVKVKVKVTHCTGTEALYRAYGP